MLFMGTRLHIIHIVSKVEKSIDKLSKNTRPAYTEIEPSSQVGGILRRAENQEIRKVES